MQDIGDLVRNIKPRLYITFTGKTVCLNLFTRLRLQTTTVNNVQSTKITRDHKIMVDATKYNTFLVVEIVIC